jgi:hypothetical protein
MAYEVHPSADARDVLRIANLPWGPTDSKHVVAGVEETLDPGRGVNDPEDLRLETLGLGGE